jgi:DNA-binding MarR family transcriptional regulator
MDAETHGQDEVAIRLLLALARLKARLREESSETSSGPSISQLSILERLRLHGPATAASLAGAEHVTGQAIAQSLVPLRQAGWVQSVPDPTDARKTLISITDAGLSVREQNIASRNSWLSRAIDSMIDPEERAALDKAIELLERLADANL